MWRREDYALVAGPVADQTADFAETSTIIHCLPGESVGGRRVEEGPEGVGIGSELGNDERHALRHQAREGGDVPREPVELGNDDGTSPAPCASMPSLELPRRQVETRLRAAP
jgi:hypothetical protein